MIAAVVGGQFGSEGKGLIAGHIAREFGVHVRVGAANAGHTVYTLHPDLENPAYTHADKHVLQQIPCAAYTNPEATLVIGPGALITPEILIRELDLNWQWRQARGHGPADIIIDRRAHVITQSQVNTEALSGLAERIGSTSATAREGIGQAQADRVMRQPWCVEVGSREGAAALSAYYDRPASTYTQILFGETDKLLHKTSSDILLEGTQGVGLSLTTGQFPYVTSRNTTTPGLCADAGVPGADRVILVCRTYPIRVAGPSGPFYSGSTEITWDEIGIDPEKERTTVTKKVRRVATFSPLQVRRAAWLAGATEIALTFADYLSPRLHGVTDLDEMDSDADAELFNVVGDLWNTTGLPVTMLGTGPHSIIDAGPEGLLS